VAKSNLILIGMPASGKSTIGVLLAKRLGKGFVDTDLMIQQREDALLQDIVNRCGVSGFLDLEQSVICSLSCANSVVAPGGSAVCRPDMAIHLKSLGELVYLRLPEATIISRMSNFATRGIAMEAEETLSDIYQKRTPLYEQYADYTADCDGKSAAQISEEIASIFLQRKRK
jgi:Shikimate kinase